MALHGISRDAWKRYGAEGYKHWDIIYPGYKYNMFDLQGALVAVAAGEDRRVPRAPRRAEGAARRRPARRCRRSGCPREQPGVKHAYHLYPIIVRTEALTADRDTVMNAIQAENVGVGVHFRAVHLQPYYVETFGFRRGDVPERRVLFGSDDLPAALSRG